MTGWLLEHQAAVQFYLWLGAFALVAVSESFGPRRTLRTATAARWSRNMALAALSAVATRACLPVSAVAAAAWAEQHGWGLLNLLSVPFWAAFAASVAVMDQDVSIHADDRSQAHGPGTDRRSLV